MASGAYVCIIFWMLGNNDRKLKKIAEKLQKNVGNVGVRTTGVSDSRGGGGE